MSRAVAAVLVASLSGCSFVLVDGGPASVPPGSPPPDCTTSKAVPLGDAAITTAAAVSGVFLPLFYLGEEDDDRKATLGGLALAAWPVAALFGISAAYGNYKVKKCRRVRNQAAQPGMQPMPGYPQPYPGSGPQPYPAPQPQPYPPPQPQPYPAPQPQPYPSPNPS